MINRDTRAASPGFPNMRGAFISSCRSAIHFRTSCSVAVRNGDTTGGTTEALAAATAVAIPTPYVGDAPLLL